MSVGVKPPTPGQIAKHFTRQDKCPPVAIIKVHSLTPAGKGGWKMVGKESVFYWDGGIVAQRRHRRVRGGGEGWTSFWGATKNGQCDGCGGLFAELDSLGLAFVKAREAGSGEVVKPRFGEPIPRCSHDWGYFCQRCKARLQAVREPPLTLDAPPGILVRRAELCDSDFIYPTRTLEEGPVCVMRRAWTGPMTFAKVFLALKDAETGTYSWIVRGRDEQGEITMREAVDGH